MKDAHFFRRKITQRTCARAQLNRVRTTVFPNNSYSYQVKNSARTYAREKTQLHIFRIPGPVYARYFPQGYLAVRVYIEASRTPVAAVENEHVVYLIRISTSSGQILIGWVPVPDPGYRYLGLVQNLGISVSWGRPSAGRDPGTGTRSWVPVPETCVKSGN